MHPTIGNSIAARRSTRHHPHIDILNRYGARIRSIFFIVAFAILLAVGVIFVAQRRLNAVGESQKGAAQLTFRSIAIADGTTPEGFEFSVHHYKTSNCVPLAYEVISFPSDAHAEKELRKKAARASEILQHAPEKDVQGNVVGERYVVKFVGPGQAAERAAIVLSRKSDLVSITSTSLTHILEFEKASNRDDRRASFPGIESVKNVTFRSAGATTGVTNEGVRFAREEFTSSDCENVTTQTWYFESAEKAQQALDRSLKSATGISERGDKVNSAGQRVGMRAVAYFEADPKSAYIEITNILWTDGAELRSIEGADVYAREFESRAVAISKQLATAPNSPSDTANTTKYSFASQSIDYEGGRVIRNSNPPHQVSVIVSIKPEHFNSDDLRKLASHFKNEFRDAPILWVQILDDPEIAKNYIPAGDMRTLFYKHRRAFYSLDRRTGKEYIEFSSKRGNPVNETRIILSPKR